MYDFKFADIGEGIHEGVILKWHFKVGDKVKEGETLVVVETDKVNAELPSPVDGVIKKLGAKEGETIHVGQTVVLIDDGTGEAEPEAPKETPKEEKKEALKEGEAAPGVIGEIEVSSDVMASSDEGSGAQAQTQSAKVLATPVARKLAKDLGVDIQQIKGTGPQGRVLKEDIEAFAQKGQQASVKSVDVPKLSVTGDVEYVNISKLRKAIVKGMTISKQVIPHTVLMDQVEIDELVELRNKVKATAAEQGIKLTYMAFVMKAVTAAIKKFPVFNASYDMEKEQIVIKNYINLGMAVDTPDGLIVPNIKHADTKSIYTLAKELREVADKTIERKVTLEELQNSTFTITNFGAANVSHGTPIINYPEVAILGVGKIEQRPVVRNGELAVAYVMPLSLAVDHRIIDGADAGRFLNYIKTLLNEPMMLLLN